MAATLITLGYVAEYEAGENGVVSSSAPLLPAAATTITPFWSAYARAAAMVGSVPVPPQLALMTLAPWLTAYSIASAAAVSVPLPEELRNCTGMSCTFQSTPVPPIPLFPTSAISPAVNVPWPFPSAGLLVPLGVLVEMAAKFQPIRSSGFDVSPSWVEPSAQPPELVGARTELPSTKPLVAVILPGPWLIGLFRSVNVMTPSS